MNRFQNLLLVAAAFVAAAGNGTAQTRSPMGPGKPPPQTGTVGWRQNTALTVTVTDPVNDVPITNWELDVFDPAGAPITLVNVWPMTPGNTWGVLLDKDYSNTILTALARADGYSSQAVYLNCAGEFIPAQFNLMPFEWKATIPKTGGLIGPFGPTNVIFNALSDTFDGDVVVHWRNLPASALTLVGIGTTELPIASYSFEVKNPNGTEYTGGWHQPLIAEMSPDANYNTAPDGSLLTFAEIFGVFSAGSTYVLEETGSQAGQLVNDTSYTVDVARNTIQVAFLRNTTFVTTGQDSTGKYQFDPKTGEWTINGLKLVVGPPIPVCTQLINGQIQCGKYKGLKFSFEKKAGEEVGDASEVLKKLEAELGADWKLLGNKITASIAGALSAKINSDGKASTTATISVDLKPNDDVADSCQSGSMIVFMLTYSMTIGYGDKAASIAVPFGISVCCNTKNDPTCGQLCGTGKDEEKKQKVPCCD
jgi:hypothetical protein